MQCAEAVELANGPDHIRIKEECAEEDMWKNDAEDRPSESTPFNSEEIKQCDV